jgi:thiamine kinase-like enzyme
MILSSERGPNEQLASQLQAFVERDFSSFVVIAVKIDSTDQRLLGPVMQAINSATTGTLKNTTYLERQDGQRVFLMQYNAPIADNLGAKFIFPRLVDGQPFLKSDSGTVRFFAQFNDSFKINMVYKVREMLFEQKLEY